VEHSRSFDDMRRLFAIRVILRGVGSDALCFASMFLVGESLNLGMMRGSVAGVLKALSICSKKRSFSFLLFHDMALLAVPCELPRVGYPNRAVEAGPII